MSPFDISHYRFIRDSRHAYGTRFEAEKPDRDWLWGIAALIVSVAAIAAMLAKVAP